jgi:hypothetical protein
MDKLRTHLMLLGLSPRPQWDVFMRRGLVEIEIEIEIDIDIDEHVGILDKKKDLGKQSRMPLVKTFTKLRMLEMLEFILKTPITMNSVDLLKRWLVTSSLNLRTSEVVSMWSRDVRLLPRSASVSTSMTRFAEHVQRMARFCSR